MDQAAGDARSVPACMGASLRTVYSGHIIGVTESHLRGQVCVFFKPFVYILEP